MTGTIAGVGMPYTYRPYWKGYDQKEDEEIAEDLFFGCLEVDKAGRPKIEYPQKNSARERMARDALARIVMYYTPDHGPVIMSLLCSALRDRATERVIDFRATRKRGRPSNHLVDAQIDHYVRGLVEKRGDVEAAVAGAEEIWPPPL